MMDIETVKATLPITLDMMPIGPVWEDDGACWKADRDEMEPQGWRWLPQNTVALAKLGPEGEMWETAPALLAGLAAAPPERLPPLEE